MTEDTEYINFDCPHCGQNLDAPADMAHTGIACPACEQAITIPGPAPAPAAGEPPREEPSPPEEEEAPEESKKRSTMRLELPQDLKEPTPRRRIVKIKRLKK